MRTLTKDKKRLRIEADIYEKVFKHTPKLMWFLLSLVLSSLIGLMGAYYFKKDFWADHGSLLVFAVVLGVIAVFPIIFTLVYKYLRSSTEYYDLRVNDRMKIKKSLQQRAWGNKLSSLFCYILIGLLLETNLHQANRRKI